MTEPDGPESRIDRIRFGFGTPNQLGTHDYGPIDSTLGTDELRTWSERLRLRYRSGDSTFHMRPETSEVYWSDGTNAAVLWRVRGGPDNRMDVCHALVGSASVLTVRDALRLDEDWWTFLLVKNRDQIQPITQATLRVDGDQVEDRRSGNRWQLEEHLAMLAAAVLSDPRRPISIIVGDVPVEQRLALLWAFHGLSEGVERDRPWTFSTYEAGHHDGVPGLPYAVCLTERPPRQAFDVTRAVVDLTNPTQRGGQAGPAREWAVEYVRGGAPAARRWLDGYLRSATHPGGPEPELTQDEPVLPPVEVDHQTSPEPDTSPAPVPDTSPSAPPQASEPRQQPPSSQPRPPAPRPQTPLLVDKMTAGSKLLKDLAQARDEGQLRMALDNIAGYRGATNPSERAEIRRQLFKENFWEPKLRELFDVEGDGYAIDHVHDALRVLIPFGLGRDDLADPDVAGETGTFLARPDTSTVVAGELALHARRYGHLTAISHGYAARWMYEKGLPKPDPVRGGVRAAARTRRNPWQVSTIALAVLVVVLLLLLVIDLSRGGNSGAVPPATTNPPTSRPPSAARATEPAPASNPPEPTPIIPRRPITVPIAECGAAQGGYVDLDEPDGVPQAINAEFSLSASCSQATQRVGVLLTPSRGISVSVVAPAASCLSEPPGSQIEAGPLQRGQVMCVVTNRDRVAKVTVVRADASSSAELEVTVWERQ